MKNQNKAISLALASVLLWSTVATAFKIALQSFSPFQLIFIAALVSFIFFGLIILFQGNARQIVQVERKPLLHSALMGFLNPFLYYLILFKAYSLNPAQVSQSLNMVWPIALAVLSGPLLGQKITRKNIWAILLGFVGVIFIASQGSVEGFANTDTLGAVLALSSSIIWAFYWILSAKDKREKLIVLFWNFAFGLLFLVLYGFISKETFYLPLGEIEILSAVYVGLFELGITYVVWMYALSLSENNAVTGNFIFLTPFLSLIFIHFILHERIYITTFFGLSFILLGIFIQQITLNIKNPVMKK